MSERLARVIGIACGVTIGVGLAAAVARIGLPRAAQLGESFRSTAVCPRCFAPVVRFAGHLCKADDDEEPRLGSESVA